MTNRFFQRALASAACITVPLAVAAISAPSASAADREGQSHLYTLSNEPGGNKVLAFNRAANGSLTPAGSFATGGNGSGGGLGSQGSVVVDRSHHVLVAVNAGSNSVSAFRVRANGSLTLMGTAPSGGVRPISVAVRDQTVVVLNATSNNVSALRLDDGLTPIVGSTRSLTGASGAEVAFAPGGERLVVTEKASNSIDVFPIDDGRIGAPTTTPSTGQTPFGFAFDPRGHLLVSNAAGGAAGASSLTSYSVRRNGVAVIDGPSPTHQSAACWVAVSDDGRFAYVTNTASGTITGYSVAADGTLSPLNANGLTATVGAGPIDAAFAGNDLYTINGGSHDITIDHLGTNGSLTDAGRIGGLPTSAVGLAVA